MTAADHFWTGCAEFKVVMPANSSCGRSADAAAAAGDKNDAISAHRRGPLAQACISRDASRGRKALAPIKGFASDQRLGFANCHARFDRFGSER